MNDWIDTLIQILIFLAVSVIIAGLSYAAFLLYQDYKSPVFTLNKNHWFCSHQYTEVYTTLIAQPNGQFMPIVNTHEVCDQYTRR